MNTKTIVIIIAVGVVMAGGGFYGGMQYQKSILRTNPFDGGLGGAPNGRGQFQGRANGTQGLRPVMGEILSVDATSMTVKLQDESSKIVLFSDTTTISTSSEGTNTDLKVGEKVSAFGTQNTDGSITAENIQLNPVMRGGGEQSGGE